VRGFLSRGSDAGLKNAVDVAHDVVVPEAQNKVSVRFEFSRSPCIIGGALGMLPAVKLNDQVRGLATEVDHIRLDRHLPPKFHSVQTTVAQAEPELSLSVGLIAP
jgi:hypothetical protein